MSERNERWKEWRKSEGSDKRLVCGFCILPFCISPLPPTDRKFAFFLFCFFSSFCFKFSLRSSCIRRFCALRSDPNSHYMNWIWKSSSVWQCFVAKMEKNRKRRNQFSHFVPSYKKHLMEARRKHNRNWKLKIDSERCSDYSFQFFPHSRFIKSKRLTARIKNSSRKNHRKNIHFERKWNSRR